MILKEYLKNYDIKLLQEISVISSSNFYDNLYDIDDIVGIKCLQSCYIFFSGNKDIFSFGLEIFMLHCQRYITIKGRNEVYFINKYFDDYLFEFEEFSDKKEAFDYFEALSNNFIGLSSGYFETPIKLSILDDTKFIRGYRKKGEFSTVGIELDKGFIFLYQGLG